MNHLDMSASTAEPEREALVIAALFHAVESLSRLEAQTLLRETVAPAPTELMSDENHLRIWAYIQACQRDGQLPALRTAVTAPELRGIPVEIWERIASPGGGALNLALELATLIEIAVRRTALQHLSRLQMALMRGAPVESTINAGLQELGGISANVSTSHDADEYADADEEEEARKAGRLAAPISTGLPSVDALLQEGGVLPGQVVGIVGETGKGKTRFGLGMVTSALKAGIGVTYCSMEQGETDEWTDADGIVKKGHRTVSALQRFAYGVGRTFRKTADSQRRKRAGLELIRQRTEGGRYGLLRVKHDSMAIEDLEREAVMAALRGHKLLVIDNLEHVQGRRQRGEGDHRYIENICHDVARIAQRNKLVVVVLMQPNRTAFGSDMPATLKEVADSFNATRPFDLILSLWRPAEAQKEAYKLSMQTAKIEADVARDIQHGPPHREMGRWVNGLVRIAKMRGGGFGGLVEVGWDEHVGRWHDLGGRVQPLPSHWQIEADEAARPASSLESAPVFEGKL